MSDDFIMWDRYSDDYYFQLRVPLVMKKDGKSYEGAPAPAGDVLVLVERPWEFENCRTLAIYSQPIPGRPTWIRYNSFDRTNVKRFPKNATGNMSFVNALA